MKYLEILRAKLAELQETRNGLLDELESITTTAADESRTALTPDEDARYAELTEAIARYDDPENEDNIPAIEARVAELEEVEAKRVKAAAAPAFIRKVDSDEVLEDRNASPAQIADAVVRSIAERGIDEEPAKAVLRRHRSDVRWSRNLLARSSDIYADAWQKYVTGREMEMSVEERTAMSVGTSADGGYLVPTFLDPTIILTNDGTSNAIRAISRVVTLTTGNTWNGVTSAGVTASWDGELVEVSDDTPADFAQPSIPTYKAQAFVQASIEAFEDISGLATDVMMMFADARDRLEGAAHATGTGSQPTGIFTALDANTNVEITSTTAATIGKEDLNALYLGVPVRHRSRSTWVMNPTYTLDIHDLGTAVSNTYSGDLRNGTAGVLLGRPVVESDDAPTTQTTTVRDNEIVLGDFSNYVIVDKPGSTAIEFIPHLFNATQQPARWPAWLVHALPQWRRLGQRPGVPSAPGQDLGLVLPVGDRSGRVPVAH